MGAAVGTALLFLPFARLGVDAHHDGLMLKSALDVLNGQVVFRDTFSQYGLLMPLLHAGELALFGSKLLVLKVATVLTYAVAAGMLVATWRRILPDPLVALALLLWWCCAPFFGQLFILLPWPSVAALAFQAASLLAFCRAVESRSPYGWASASGTAAALAQLARTPVGIAHTVAMAGAFLYLLAGNGNRRRAWSGFLAFVIGAAATHLVALGLLARSDLLSPWYAQTIADPARWAGPRIPSMASIVQALLPMDSIWFRANLLAKTGTFVPPSAWDAVLVAAAVVVLPLVARRPAPRALAIGTMLLVGAALLIDPPLVMTTATASTVIPLALVFCLVRQTWRSMRHRQDEDAALGVALAIPALASWHQYLPLPDPRHVFWALGPMAGVYVWVVWRSTKARTGATAVMLAGLLIPLAMGRVADVIGKLRQPLRAVRGVPVLDGMRANPREATAYEDAYAAIERVTRVRPETMLVVAGGDALLATFVPNLRNWSPYFVHWSGLPPPDEDERLRFIAARRPLVLVVRSEQPSTSVLERTYGYRELHRGPTGLLMGPSRTGDHPDLPSPNDGTGVLR